MDYDNPITSFKIIESISFMSKVYVLLQITNQLTMFPNFQL
jgi:hypothetical protein